MRENMEIKITDANFEEEVIKSGIPVLVDFYADWCGPCKMMAPLVSEMAQKYEGRCKVGKCNVDENPQTAEKFRIMSIPTFILFKEGAAVQTAVGGMSKAELEAKIDQVLS